MSNLFISCIFHPGFF